MPYGSNLNISIFYFIQLRFDVLRTSRENGIDVPQIWNQTLRGRPICRNTGVGSPFLRTPLSPTMQIADGDVPKWSHAVGLGLPKPRKNWILNTVLILYYGEYNFPTCYRLCQRSAMSSWDYVNYDLCGSVWRTAKRLLIDVPRVRPLI